MIPKEDTNNFLPVRWAFHCYCGGGKPQWDFFEWRDYLLEMEIDLAGCAQDFILNKSGFQVSVLSWLAVENVETIPDIISLYHKCFESYPGSHAN